MAGEEEPAAGPGPSWAAAFGPEPGFEDASGPYAAVGAEEEFELGLAGV